MAERTADASPSPTRVLPVRGPRSDPGGPGLLRSPRARAVGLVVAVGALAVTLLASVLVGYRYLSPTEVYSAYWNFTGSDTDLVVLHLRVPRALAGVAVGAALGVSGVLVQGITRNPLGDPGILGINSGASLATVVAIGVLGISALPVYVLFAFGGAALAAVMVHLVGSLGSGGSDPIKLTLAGAALSALLGSVTSALVLSDRASLEEYRFWVVGSLSGSEGMGAVLGQAAPFLLLGMLLAFGSTRALNAVALGDDLARSLGTRVWAVRAVSALAVVLLAGTATAVAGPIGFVGIAVPHIARLLVGPDHRWVLPWSAVLAPILLLTADMVGRVVARPEELQVGIVTALIGAPFFIVLVRRRRVAGL